MKKTITLLLIMIVVGIMFSGCQAEINSGDRDILYNGVVYERCDDANFNICLYEDNARYIGDFLETYNYGQQLPWEVYVLNGDENVLYSSNAIWVRPGYSIPDNFGVAFSSAEYVISEGIDFLVMEDNYTEEATLLVTFDGVVALEDIVETEPSEITGYTEYDDIRFRYTHHADMAVKYAICSLDGKYYLNICQGQNGTDEWHEIKQEYVGILTSAISDTK